MILQPCDLQSIFFAPFVVGALLLVFKSFLFQELILGNLLTYSCITVITLGLLWFYWFEDFVLYFLYWLTATSHHHCQRRVWTFKDIITGLYDQFIHESSIQDTTQKFYSVKYTMDGGVYGFYHELEHYASRMIHAPNSYTFNTQLIMGLPASMIWLVVDKGVTSETSSLNEILHMAKCIKEGNKVMWWYDDRCRVRVAAPSHAIRAAQMSHPSPTSSWPIQSTRSTPAPASHLKSWAPEQRAPNRSGQLPDCQRVSQLLMSHPGNSSNNWPWQ